MNDVASVSTENSVYGGGIVTEAWNSFKRKPKHANFITVIETLNFPSLYGKEGENKTSRGVEVLSRRGVSQPSSKH